MGSGHSRQSDEQGRSHLGGALIWLRRQSIDSRTRQLACLVQVVLQLHTCPQLRTGTESLTQAIGHVSRKPDAPVTTRDKVTRFTPSFTAASVTVISPKHSRRISPGCGGLCIRVIFNLGGNPCNRQARHLHLQRRKPCASCNRNLVACAACIPDLLPSGVQASPDPPLIPER